MEQGGVPHVWFAGDHGRSVLTHVLLMQSQMEQPLVLAHNAEQLVGIGFRLADKHGLPVVMVGEQYEYRHMSVGVGQT